jgi:glycosyltransferase involved in cell wall biosynthesis
VSAKPIRVLLAINTLARGGAERQLVELATGLDRERFSVSVLCVVGGGPLADELIAAGIPVAIFDSRNPLELLRLTAHVRTQAPDVVHSFLFGSNIIATLAATLARTPVVITSRRSLGFFKDGRPHYEMLQALANRFTDVVIANSEAVRDDTLKRERLESGKVRVIFNGVGLDASSADRDRTRASLRGEGDRGGALVVVVANLIPYKGLDYFVDAWRDVVRTLPGARAIVVGEGPARTELEARAADIGGSIRFVGSRHDVPELLQAADLVVQSSLYEGFPNAVLEAMAAGRPVVATAVGGTVEAVVSERTGILVPPRDSAALAAAIQRILTKPDLARSYGLAGRKRVEDDFSVARMVDRYADLYRELAPTEGTPPPRRNRP